MRARAMESASRNADARLEREAQEATRIRAEQRKYILGPPSFDTLGIRAAADGLRKIALDFQKHPVDQIQIEKLGIDLLVQAIQAGAFSGHDWMLWRTRLARRPHILNAIHWIGLPNYLHGGWDGPAPADPYGQTFRIFADKVEEFATESDRKISSRPDGRRKTPPPEAFAAYRIHVATGSSQKVIAELLSKELRRSVSQGQVSRWLQNAIAFIAAGNILPELGQRAKKERGVDPASLEIGKRTDRLTPRQRMQKTDEN